MRRALPLVVVVGVGATVATSLLAVGAAANNAPGELKYRAFAPQVTRAEIPPTPTPVPLPVPYNGPVASLHLSTAKVDATWPVEVRDTYFAGGREFFQDPSAPERIAWYARFGQPGYTGANSIFAAHIDYVGFGKGPFGYLTNAAAGEALHVTMDNGTSYSYTVKSVSVVSLQDLDMNAVVFPVLAGGVERVTLISCGGTFVPYAGGGGEYSSRVILVAERYVN
ncbi:MAG: class F sortase [Dehalococcoidia bacterium]|nr:class F sortase [Dehalococcoidia bacterium]